MPQYVALLRGVSPLNAKMPELKACFEKAGFKDVRTVLGTGNVVFSSTSKSPAALEKKIEAALVQRLKHKFPTIVRSLDELKELVEEDPFKKLKLTKDSKRIVTFLKKKVAFTGKLPVKLKAARIFRVDEREVFTIYVPDAKSPVFMVLIEKTFGKEVTTRTWDTVKKIIR